MVDDVRSLEAGDEIQATLSTPESELPVIYFNGFTMTMTAPDAVIILERNNAPVLVLNCSHEIAKTMAQALGGIVAGFEQGIGTEFLTTHQIKERIASDGDS